MTTRLPHFLSLAALMSETDDGEDPSPRAHFAAMTAQGLASWGRGKGLAPIPEEFMPELQTVIDPVTMNVLRHAAHWFGDWEVRAGAVLCTREMAESNTQPDYMSVDTGLRALIWYCGEALALDNPDSEIKAFVSEVAPRRRGEVYSAEYDGDWPRDLSAISSIEGLMRWGPKNTPEIGAGVKFQRSVFVCGNGDETAAVGELSRECAVGLAFFMSARHEVRWRVPPRIEVQIDKFGRKVVTLYARMCAGDASIPHEIA